MHFMGCKLPQTNGMKNEAVFLISLVFPTSNNWKSSIFQLHVLFFLELSFLSQISSAVAVSWVIIPAYCQEWRKRKNRCLLKNTDLTFYSFFFLFCGISGIENFGSLWLQGHSYLIFVVSQQIFHNIILHSVFFSSCIDGDKSFSSFLLLSFISANEKVISPFGKKEWFWVMRYV